MSQRDAIYAQPQEQVVDFAFTPAVADVFPDMIRRSVPGYESIISSLAVIGQDYIQPNTAIYDLGCSLGASTLALASRAPIEGVNYVCVDSSQAMVERCEQIMQRHLPRRDVSVQCADIRSLELQPASVIVLNFTLQFLPREDREALLQKLYQALVPNGVLILSEKLSFSSNDEQTLQTDLHLAFKRANGYSELEISQKRTALENVMLLDTADTHIKRLKSLGFQQVIQWYQCMSFASFMAVKS